MDRCASTMYAPGPFVVWLSACVYPLPGPCLGVPSGSRLPGSSPLWLFSSGAADGPPDRQGSTVGLVATPHCACSLPIVRCGCHGVFCIQTTAETACCSHSNLLWLPAHQQVRQIQVRALHAEYCLACQAFDLQRPLPDGQLIMHGASHYGVLCLHRAFNTHCQVVSLPCMMDRTVGHWGLHDTLPG